MGNFGGYLQTYDFPEDYYAIYKSNSSNATYNTLILPFIRPIQYDALKLAGVDPISKYWANNILPTEFDGQILQQVSLHGYFLSCRKIKLMSLEDS